MPCRRRTPRPHRRGVPGACGDGCRRAHHRADDAPGGLCRADRGHDRSRPRPVPVAHDPRGAASRCRRGAAGYQHLRRPRRRGGRDARHARERAGSDDRLRPPPGDLGRRIDRARHRHHRHGRRRHHRRRHAGRRRHGPTASRGRKVGVLPAEGVCGHRGTPAPAPPNSPRRWWTRTWRSPACRPRASS